MLKLLHQSIVVLSIGGALSGGPTDKLTRHLDKLEDYGFSGAVLVAVDGKVLVHRGYGSARKQPDVPMQPETLFPVASMTKQFTAAAILKLESEGKLRVSDTVAQHLPGTPADKQGITLHQLMTHTSGLVFECPGEPADKQEFLHRLWKTRLGEPGVPSYSNAGFALLAAVIEQVSGISYQTYLKSSLLVPSGMEKSGFLDDKDRFSGRLAHQYTWSVDHEDQLDEPFHWNLRGSADLVTTAGDLLRWEQSLEAGRILPEEERQKLFQPYVADSESGLKFGYGWLISRREGAYRSGGTFGLGFNTAMRVYPAKKAVAIVLSNQNYGLLMSTAAAMDSVEGILLGRRYTALPDLRTASPGLLEKCPGVFEVPGGGQLDVTVQGNGLLISPRGQAAVNLLTCRRPEEARHLESDTQRAERFMQTLQQRRFSELGTISGEPQSEELESAYRNWIEGLEARLGSLQSTRVIGTIPQGASSRSYVELQFENGREVRRLRWIEGRLISILTGALPLAPTLFLPMGEKRLAGFHLAFGRVIGLRIRTDSEGRVQALRFDTPSGKVTAQRVR